MLQIKNLSVSYGAIEAVKNISLTVNDGEIVSLIGANGAGKTTTLHTITGLTPAVSGEVLCNGVAEKTAHTTQKPEALIERLILASSRPGDLVVDPFVGSGTTAVVAARLGRRFLCGAADGRFVGLARDRLTAEAR